MQDLWIKREIRKQESQSHNTEAEKAGDEHTMLKKGTATWQSTDKKYWLIEVVEASQ